MLRAIVSALIVATLPSCRSHEGEAEFWSNERQKTELIHRLKLAEYQLSLPNARSGQELIDLRNLITEMELRLHDIQSKRSALISEIATMTERNMKTSKAALVRLREKSQGTNFDTIITNDDKIYHNVKVVKVDDSGVLIRHENGSARLGYADLTNDQRLFFGIEESSALAAVAREREEALNYEQSIDIQMAAISANKKTAAEKSTAENRLWAMRASDAVASKPREPSLLSQPARPFGTNPIYRRSSGYSYSGDYRPAYRYLYVVPSLPNPFCSSKTTQTYQSNKVFRSPYLPTPPCSAPVRKRTTLQTPTTP